MPRKPKNDELPVELIQDLIHNLRGERVILDEDLAALYGVETRRLNEQVKRNQERFPLHFSFPLTQKEFANLKSQSATSRWGGRRTLPTAFTEHGTLMAASVLNTPQAIRTSILVIEAFVQMRRMIGAVASMATRLDALERKMVDHDENFSVVFEAVRRLMDEPEEKPKSRIGFRRDDS